MRFKVWGARGSIPVSGPHYDVYGGDTTCLEVRTADGETVILDAGTGIRPLGIDVLQRNGTSRQIHFFLTHAHWDHVMGFPFFKPIYRKEYAIRLHGCTSAQESIRTFLEEAMHPPFFPVNLEDMSADLHFSQVCADVEDIGSLRVRSFPLNHPNQGFGFRVEEGDRSFAFFPDNELTYEHDGGRNFAEYVEFVEGVDWLIHDGEYLTQEYESFSRGWGHSVFLDTVRLAMEAGAGGLILWHINQERTDREVDAMVASAREAVEAAGADLPVHAARVGMEIEIQ
ncbi:MAG: MBL fold metallo-hydrolase [Planctomycetota bacterium]|jgi:phosphoribosyl 1,2-cyclic phosphodiesterase